MTIEADLKFGYTEPGGGRLDFNFQVTLPGQGVTAVTGPSGAGKTTFLRCLAGLVKSEGRLTVNDHLWQDKDFFLPTFRRPLGYVFQEASLFPHLTVRQNLAYGLKRRRRRGYQGFDDLDKFIEILGIGHLMDRKPDTLSGGERQRTALARALAPGPEVLLLDEPLAALDQDRKEEILPYLESLKELTLPIIYVSHSRDEIERLATAVMHLTRPEENSGTDSSLKLDPGPQRQKAVSALVTERRID